MKTGDDTEERFVDFVRSQHAALVAHVERVYPGSDTDSIVNGTFAVAWRRFDSIDADSARAWLRATARHLVLNSSRSERRQHALRNRAERMHAGPSQVDAPHGPAHDEVQLVLAALDTLSPADQDVLRMCAFEELSNDELGQILGITVNAAKVRLSRARARLRDAVSRLSREDEGVTR
jgi:RNA polymerase sigma factor (sigma-70 family)